MGVLATSGATAGASAAPASYHHPTASSGSTGDSAVASQQDPSSSDAGSQPGGSVVGPPQQSATSAELGLVKALPGASGHGRRIVFSQSRQRVWLVAERHGSDHVDRTYPVSGSVYHNLQPGTYSVYSKSRWAVGVDDSGVMQYFVRFTQGPTGAAIGFHSIPTQNGVPLQKRSQLGTPQSHGCVRQWLPDAIALWNFAPDGTKVVVTA
jgi:lipoprotein-anchoring transpeptidase ErfK/SrfK